MLGSGDTAANRQTRIPIKPHEVQGACLVQRDRVLGHEELHGQGPRGGKELGPTAEWKERAPSLARSAGSGSCAMLDFVPSTMEAAERYPMPLATVK